jgi:hypothetical protein
MLGRHSTSRPECCHSHRFTDTTSPCYFFCCNSLCRHRRHFELGPNLPGGFEAPPYKKKAQEPSGRGTTSAVNRVFRNSLISIAKPIPSKPRPP